MVDSVKNYGIAGVSANVELGKGGSVINGGSSSDVISLKLANADLSPAEIGNASSDTHAVTKAQFDANTSSRVQIIKETVNFNSGTISLFTVPADTTILSTYIEKGTGNWTNYNDTTDITVGDTGNNSRLFSAGFVPDGTQHIDETNHLYSSATEIFAYVTQGGASAGTAIISIKLSGADVTQ